MEWSDELITEYLRLYERECVIWNPQHKDHKNKDKIYEAWKRIQSNLSIECSLEELKKKKVNLMATYRKLASKVKNSVRSGAAPNEVFKPEWFLYEKIDSFLHNVYTPRETRTTESNFLEEEEDERLNMSESSGHSVILENEEAAAVNVTLRPRDKKRKIEHVEKCMDEAYSFLKQAASKPKSQLLQEDERLNMNESSGQSAVLENEEVAAVNIDVPPRGKKRNAELIEKCINEACSFLKRATSKPKVIKDQSYLFCELLCCRLRELDDHSRKMAMHEIDNLMYDFHRNSRMALQYYHQQPGYFLHDHATSQNNEPSVTNMFFAPSLFHMSSVQNPSSSSNSA